MRRLCWFALMLLLVPAVASPALARMAVIETTAPLQDHAEQSIQAAFKEAVESAVRGAVAMGLTWVEISRALVLQDLVIAQILATDTKPEGEEGGEEEEPWQGGKPGAWSAQPMGHGL